MSINFSYQTIQPLLSILENYENLQTHFCLFYVRSSDFIRFIQGEEMISIVIIMRNRSFLCSKLLMRLSNINLSYGDRKQHIFETLLKVKLSIFNSDRGQILLKSNSRQFSILGTENFIFIEATLLLLNWNFLKIFE